MAIIVSLDGKRKPRGGPRGVEGLRGLVSDRMDRVDGLIRERMVSAVEPIPALADHLIGSGGKRLRPLITLASAKLSGYRGEGPEEGDVLLAVAVEFMHTATLLHDDVVDESDMRRGRRTARMIWGNPASVLVGDFLLGRAFELMVAAGSGRCLEILSRAASVIAEGEVMQLSVSGDLGTTEDTCLKVIESKTAALFSAAAEVGGALAQRPEEEMAALRSYGRNLGIAFQLVDDALDYGGDQSQMGKNVGDDFREGKITLPVILAFRRGDSHQREFWRRVMGGKKEEGDLDHAMDLLRQHGAVSGTVERARHYGAIARDALAIFPAGPVRAAMDDVIDFSIERAC